MLYKKYEFLVQRKTDLGYILKKDNVEYFLHYKDTNDLEISSKVDAVLYLDKYKRVCACTKIDDYKELNGLTWGLFKIVSIKEYGIFIDVNTSKDLLLSTKYLPNQKKYYPSVDTYLPIVLEDNNEKPIARLFKLTELNKKEYLQKDKIKGIVYYIRDKNIILVDDNLNKLLLDKKYLLNKKIKIGDVLDLKVIKNNLYYTLVMLDEDKSTSLENEKNYVLNILKTNYKDGYMYTSKCDPSIIFKDFKITKKAFKRAIGILYKERKIEILTDKILLKR